VSPEIGGWNPAFVFGVAVLAAVVVIGWMWTGSWRMKADFKANSKGKLALDVFVMSVILWVPLIAWRSAG
jgi:hypothetical protein